MIGVSSCKSIVSTEITLVGSVFLGGFLGCTSSTTLSNLSNSNIPSIEIAPSISELSDRGSVNSKTGKHLLNSQKNETKFTQKQLHCAEVMGIDPSECTKKGRLSRLHRDSKKSYSINKRDDSVSLKQMCADRLNVSLEDCNNNGVFIARSLPVLNLLMEEISDNTTSWMSSDLLSLNIMELVGRSIESLGRHDFDGLTNLEYIYLSFNQLTSIPDTIWNLPNLLTLSLDNNQLTSLPNVMWNLTQLHSLDLSKNQLTSLPDSIRDLVNLDILYLNDNQLIEISDQISFLKKLRYFYLENNNLTRLPEEISLLKNLNILFLDNNDLTHLPVEIGLLPALFSLSLNNKESSQNRLIIDPLFFDNILSYQKHLSIIFKNTTYTNNLETSIILNNQPIPLSDVIDPFFESSLSIVGALSFVVPDLRLTETPVDLTLSQQLFMVSYLRSKLENSTYEWVQEIFNKHECIVNSEACINSTGTTSVVPTLTVSMIPTVTESVVPTLTVSMIPTVTESVVPTVKTRFNMRNLYVAIPISLVVLVIGLSIGLGVVFYLKTKMQLYNIQNKSRIINNKQPIPTLADDLVSHKESVESIHDNKEPETDDKMLYNLSINHPEVLERWVQEGRLDIESDLGNTKEDGIDDDGNSILHSLAINYIEIIDRWVKTGAVSSEVLDSIKNNKGQSVLFYIENIAPEVFSTWNNESIV